MKRIPKVTLYRSEGKQSVCDHARPQTSDPHHAPALGRTRGTSTEFSINLGLALLFQLWIVTPAVPNQLGPGSITY